jgi:hypothetical protein
VKLKELALTPGLPKAPGRLHISSYQNEKEKSVSSGHMNVIQEVNFRPNYEYGTDFNMTPVKLDNA